MIYGRSESVTEASLIDLALPTGRSAARILAGVLPAKGPVV